MSVLVVLVVAVPSTMVLIGFLAYLRLCWCIVTTTSATEGLRDVAVAVRAFRNVLSIRRQ